MADKYCVQKATEYDDQSAGWKKLHELASLERTHIAQRKYDGCLLIVRIGTDGTGEAFSRTSEPVTSCDHIVAAVSRVYGPGWVVFGEAYQEGVKFPTISGDYRRHSPSPQMRFVVYDIVPSGSFAIGLHDVPYSVRMRHLYGTIRQNNFPDSPLVEAAYYPPGTYGDPQQLANQLVAQGGYDGLILRDPDAHWVKDTARNGELLKVKPVQSFDLRVTGVEEGLGKMAGMAGKLVLDFRGKDVRAGGLDYDTRRRWFTSPESIIGQIVEVECLGVTEDGSLREPRIKGVRHDKLKPD